MKFKLDDFPPSVQAQIRRKLGLDSAPSLSAFSSPDPLPVKPAAIRSSRPSDEWLGASKTEIEYYRRNLSDRPFSLVYEPVRLRIAPGTFYTPDFFYYDASGCVAVEVKGSYRLGSASRAYTAFMACRERYPWIRFLWFAWDSKKREFIQKH